MESFARVPGPILQRWENPFSPSQQASEKQVFGTQACKVPVEVGAEEMGSPLFLSPIGILP